MGIQRGDITPGSEGYPHIRGVGGEAASGTCLIDGRRVPSSEVTNENQEKKNVRVFFCVSQLNRPAI